MAPFLCSLLFNCYSPLKPIESSQYTLKYSYKTESSYDSRA